MAELRVQPGAGATGTAVILTSATVTTERVET